MDPNSVEPDNRSILDEKITPRESSSILTPGVGIAIVASIAVLFLLYWARSVLIPIALAVFLRYALMPVVAWLRVKARIPRPIGAALVLVLIVVGLVFSTVALEDQAVDLLDKLPTAAQKFERAVRQSAKDAEGTLSKITRAATEIDKAASTAAEPVGRAAPAAHAANLPSLRSYLWSGSFSLATAAAQSVVVLALAYFLLIAGDEFRRKIVRISGDTLASKKITVHILQEIDQQIQRYLFVQLGTSVVNGIATWIALASVGLENAAFWGLVAGVLHFVPYVGPTTVIVLTTIVAYLQFPTLAPVALVCGIQLAIAGAIGFGLVPWLTGKLSRLNAVTVFVALLVWGWLWGIWGLLLGVPIVMAFQAICERVPELQDMADLLGPGPELMNAAPLKQVSSETGPT